MLQCRGNSARIIIMMPGGPAGGGCSARGIFVALKSMSLCV